MKIDSIDNLLDKAFWQAVKKAGKKRKKKKRHKSETKKRYWVNCYKENFVELTYPFLKNLKNDFLSCSALYLCDMNTINYREKNYIWIRHSFITGWECRNYLRRNHKSFIKMSKEEEKIIDTPMCEIDIYKWRKNIPLKDKIIK